MTISHFSSYMRTSKLLQKVGTAFGLVAGLVSCLALAPVKTLAQTHDARVVPKGALRFSFAPVYDNYGQRFALNNPNVIDGQPEPLGVDLTTDSTGTNLFPQIAASETAIQDLIGDALYRINAGAFNTIRDADIRYFPFGFAYGLTDRLTVHAEIPLVTTRSQVTFSVDSTGANVGLNLSDSLFGNLALATDAQAFIAQLSNALVELETKIADGTFGCPTNPLCLTAQTARDKLLSVINNLSVLQGSNGTQLFAPLASSSAGIWIINEIETLKSQLAGLGILSAIAGNFPLPTEPVTAEDINTILGATGLGFEADPIGFNRRTVFGDISVGVRYGLIQSPRFRVLVSGTMVLPTGDPAHADNFVSLDAGDGQMDAVVGLEAAIEPRGGVGITFGASYTAQLSHSISRRLGPPSLPIRPLSAQGEVRRDLGDIIQLNAYPFINLSDGFRVFGSMSYFQKGNDSYESAGIVDSDPWTVRSLEQKTEMRVLSFGGGIAYRAERTMTERTLPIEAGLSISSAFTGSGGLTPRGSRTIIYLRLFFGKAQTQEN